MAGDDEQTRRALELLGDSPCAGADEPAITGENL
jgi:hypothetical protein